MNYGIVSAVDPDSPAELAGVIPGDRLISINGNDISDIIDYRFHTSEELVDLVMLRKDEMYEVEIEKDFDEPLGLEFTDELFDGIRTCDNCCIFCFVHQLPKGMRKSLYIRDDDYRLSFLHGNFITLASVTEADLKRIITQRLSPMYVSVHATDESLRRQLICNPNAPEITHQLKTLAEGRILLHTQIVLCRGYNDGEHLEKTISDLASLYPAVESIAVVPVGLTKHRKRKEPIPPVDREYAKSILSQVKARQKEFLNKYGTRLVYASDEMYLAAGVPIPSARSYEGFPQIENGVGIVRQFMDRAARALRTFPNSLNRPLKATIITGTLAAPTLEKFAEKLTLKTEGLEVKVEPIVNDFFGHTVTVTGLLAGHDVIAQLKDRDLGDAVILPSVFLREGLFLDDVPVEQVEQELGVPVHVVFPRPAALTAKILEITEK